MAIPEADLTVMAHIGAQRTSQETYATIKLALENKDAGYNNKNYKIFLQGSYGNDTNILKESDVDIVIRLDSVFTYDLSGLPTNEKEAFKTAYGDAAYTHKNFREDVLDVLRSRFGVDVVPGKKAVMIKPLHNRRKADVIIATRHKKYNNFRYIGNESEISGISFHKLDGTRVVNYPKQHRENLISKNQASSEWLKHIIRIFKNARQKMIEQRCIEAGIAPSYFIEGMLYNVPTDKFGRSYESSMINCINWLLEADSSRFICANEQYKLFDTNPDISWNADDYRLFLNGLVDLWNDW